MQDIIHANIADSFVKRNKLCTPANLNKDRPSSGEARLYIGSIDAQIDFFAFSSSTEYRSKNYTACTDKCYFNKSNLLQYLKDAKDEYLSPTRDYFYDITDDYFDYLKEVLSLPDLVSFNVFHHKGPKDKERLFINSTSDIWDLFRRIALPRISTIEIKKIIENGEKRSYYFEISLNEEYKTISKTKINTLNSNNSSSEIDEDYITDVVINTTARRGHSKYSNSLFKTMNTCPFTGISNRNLLRASHIKPWSLSTTQERLNGYNGLALTPTYDLLFDRGLISFEDNGLLILSPLLSNSTINNLNLDVKKYDICNQNGNRSKYLKYHRENILKKL